MFSVWFECKTCRGSFLELSHFLEHKKQDHFDEFLNTECIVFEERRIPIDEQMTVSFSPTPQEIGEINTHEFIDPQILKIEDFDDCTSSEFQSHTDQALNFFEPDYTISSDQNFQNEADDIISSINKASATHSVTSSELENSTATNATCLDENSCENTKPILDLENTADAVINVNPDAFNSSDLEPTQLFVETQRNPFVLLKRLTCQEIQRWSGIGLKRSRSVKHTENTDSVVHSIGKCSDKNLNNLFECKLCLDKITDLELTAHTSSCILSSPNRKNFCATCNRIFSTIDSLNKHVIRNHPEKQNPVKSKKLKKCHLCSKKFLYKYDLTRHTLTHKNKMQKPSSRPFKSQRVGTSINNKNKLPQHSTRDAAEKQNEQSIIVKTCPNITKTKTNDNDRLRPTIRVSSGSQKFNCNQPRCSKTFKWKSHLKIHMVTHLDGRPLKCPKPNCKKTFKRKDCVRRHIINVHSDAGRPFKCPKPNCKKTFKRKDCVLQHTINVHSDARQEKRSQVNCRKRITKNNYFSKLAPTHLNRALFQCPISSCPQTFKHKYSIPVHMLLHSGLRKFKCTQIDCGKKFKQRHHLQNHLTTHSDAKPFKRRNSSCEKTFRTSVGARNHMEVHSGLQLKKCPEVGCKKMFKSKHGLHEHLRTHQYIKPNECSGIESENVTNTNSEDTHSVIKIYSGPFECNHPNCGKLFPLKCRLKRHEATHSDARPFKCPEQSCTKSYKEKNYLHIHVRMHAKSKLSSKNDFKTRKQISEDASSKSTTKDKDTFSTDSMSFKCNKLHCGKEFMSKFNLERHCVTVHLGKKPFKCPVSTCDYACSQKNHLKEHLLTKKHTDIQNSLTD